MQISYFTHTINSIPCYEFYAVGETTPSPPPQPLPQIMHWGRKKVAQWSHPTPTPHPPMYGATRHMPSHNILNWRQNKTSKTTEYAHLRTLIICTLQTKYV